MGRYWSVRRAGTPAAQISHAPPWVLTLEEGPDCWLLAEWQRGPSIIEQDLDVRFDSEGENEGAEWQDWAMLGGGPDWHNTEAPSSAGWYQCRLRWKYADAPWGEWKASNWAQVLCA